MAIRRRPLNLPPDAVLETARDRIGHVVVLMLENRSFDHLLGYLDHPAPDFPGLARASYPNPVQLDNPQSETADVSPDAEHRLATDPPHGHESIKRTMNGHRWRAFRMNGFAAAYGQKLAGREHVPFIYWGRIQALGVVLAGIVAAAAQDFYRLANEGGFGRYLALAAIVVAVFFGVGMGLARLASLLGRARDILVATVVGGVVVTAAGQAIRHGFYGHWIGLAVTWAVGGGLATRLVRQAREKRKLRARAPLDQVAERSKHVMRCMAPEKIPVLGELARQFTVCTNWHSSVPGATWPNRLFAHAATSDGSVDIEIGLYGDTTIFDQLGRPGWRVYHDGMAQVMCYEQLWEGGNEANWRPMERFYEDVAPGGGGLPPYTFIEPCHDGPTSNSQHPGNNQRVTGDSTDFQRGETLMWRIYEALRSNADLFGRTVFLITYDEHGGLFDHAPPPRALAPGTGTRRARLAHLTRRFIAWFVENRNSPFDFRCLGVRVPTVVISPWVETSTWDPTLYDHTSLVASVRAWFAPDQGPLSRRDAAANTFLHLVARRAAPREPMPVVARPPDGGPAVGAEAVPDAPEAPAVPVPSAVHPATVGDDLRDQLVTLAAKVEEKLPPAAPSTPTAPGLTAAAPDDAVARFQAHAQRARE